MCVVTTANDWTRCRPRAPANPKTLALCDERCSRPAGLGVPSKVALGAGNSCGGFGLARTRGCYSPWYGTSHIRTRTTFAYQLRSRRCGAATFHVLICLTVISRPLGGVGAGSPAIAAGPLPRSASCRWDPCGRSWCPQVAGRASDLRAGFDAILTQTADDLPEVAEITKRHRGDH